VNNALRDQLHRREMLALLDEIDRDDSLRSRRNCRRETLAEDTIILDSGALSAIAGGNKTIRVTGGKALVTGGKLIAPVVVVAESTRTGGAGDSAVN
jgi:hypothetical protein